MDFSGTRQYYPIPEIATNIGAPLSVHLLQSTAQNLVNLHKYVANHKLVAINQPNPPAMPYVDNTRVQVYPSLIRYIPDGYNELVIVAHHRRVAGAGNVTWVLFVTSGAYFGPAWSMDPDYFVSGYTAANVTSWDSTANTPTRTAYRWPLPTNIPGPQGEIVFTLAAINAVAGTQAMLDSLDIWPEAN